MKKLVYYILLSISALSFSACTDYINVDKYFYDQVIIGFSLFQTYLC